MVQVVSAATCAPAKLVRRRSCRILAAGPSAEAAVGSPQSTGAAGALAAWAASSGVLAWDGGQPRPRPAGPAGGRLLLNDAPRFERRSVSPIRRECHSLFLARCPLACPAAR
jgi:hypothetical protein